MNTANGRQEIYKYFLKFCSQHTNGVKNLKKKVAPFVFLLQKPQIAGKLTIKHTEMKLQKEFKMLIVIATILFAHTAATAQEQTRP